MTATLRVPGWKRVADRLADGQWHSSFELASQCSVMSHSRVAELRGKGYVIGTRRVSGAEGLHAFEYQLVSTPGAEIAEQAGAANTPRVAAASLSAPGAEQATAALHQPTAELGEAPVFVEGQLSVFDALGAVA